MPELDSGATAWILTSAALVLLMTPGLALFYGGMTRSKSVLNMMMMSFGAIGVVSLLWVFYGYSLTFGVYNSLIFANPRFTQAVGIDCQHIGGCRRHIIKWVFIHCHLIAIHI